MSQNVLQFNQDETEASLTQRLRERNWPSNEKHWDLPGLAARNLGVISDSDLYFMCGVRVRVSHKTAFYHLKNISKVRPFLSLSNTERLMHAFITSRLGYCNAILSGLPENSINHLQSIQNSAAQVLSRTKDRTHITPILTSLHWLPGRPFRSSRFLSLLFHKALKTYLVILVITLQTRTACQCWQEGIESGFYSCRVLSFYALRFYPYFYPYSTFIVDNFVLSLFHYIWLTFYCFTIICLFCLIFYHYICIIICTALLLFIAYQQDNNIQLAGDVAEIHKGPP